jgi:hypothetical protein
MPGRGRPHKVRARIICVTGDRWLGCAGWQGGGGRPPTTGRRRARRTCTPGPDRRPRPGSPRAARALAACWREARDASWRQPAPPPARHADPAPHVARTRPRTRHRAFVWVGNDRERHVTLLGHQFRWRGREHHHLADAGCHELLMPLGNSPQVQVAERTAGVAAELEADDTGWIRELDRLGAGRHQLPSADDRTGRSWFMVHLPLCCATATGLVTARARKSSTVAV